MSPFTEWTVPPSVQPKPGDYGYDLEQALNAVVSLTTHVPPDAFTAETLGTERAGNGVVIQEDGLVLTIGYLIAEAETIWLTSNNGRSVPAHAVAYDHVTGFGLAQALARFDVPALPLGDSHRAVVGERVVVAGAGGRGRSLAAQVVARQEFAGYWEYLLEDAIFTAPAHPHWGGAALIGPTGELWGIGSLQLQHASESGRMVPLNMSVPIDLLKPILGDLVTLGRPKRPARPWLGLYAGEVENKVVVIGIAPDGPAQQAGIEIGDLVLAVAGRAVGTLASFFRRMWDLGEAGTEVPLTVHREGRTFETRVVSGDRNRFLKPPRLH